MNNYICPAIIVGMILTGCHEMKKAISRINTKVLYQSEAFTVYSDSVVQDAFVAKALSRDEIVSDYVSHGTVKSPVVQFKFSINGADNSAPAGNNNVIVCTGDSGVYEPPVVTFGGHYRDTTAAPANSSLKKDVKVKLRVDMTGVLNSFREKGYYRTFDGKKIYRRDFHGVYVAGNVPPLTWDWNNLYSHRELQMTDSNHDGIYEITLTLNSEPDENRTSGRWKLGRDISAFPQYRSDNMLPDALYNLALEEMQNAIEPDSTFRTGKEWAGVWTRDISYSIILSMGILQPRVAMISLKKKVHNGKIIQDTGTGGAYPISTDREIWAVAAWEVYKVTGDKDWLKYAYTVVKNSIDQDLLNIYDANTGMVRGESSFLDWREESYPRWMQPADIFESECLGTNAVHYEANTVLSAMAAVLGHSEDEKKYAAVADRIKKGVNQYLWQKDKGYFGQYLYGRNFKLLSPRAEALGEALSIYFGVADSRQKQQEIVARTPVTPYGISCIYPQIPGIPPYHNDAVWPFVESYWALASAAANNEQSVVRAMCSVYRPAALFLTNKENFVASDGDYAGTQINSSNMLWSLSGNLSLVYRLLFGIRFDTDHLSFSPYVPKAFEGKRSLDNFTYRKAVLNIEMSGYGNIITYFSIDGKETSDYTVAGSLTGTHAIRIVLGNVDLPIDKVNGVKDLFSPETPQAAFSGGKISWQDTGKNVSSYQVIKNGALFKTTDDSSLAVDEGYGNYQVIAAGRDGTSSFASEPVQLFPLASQQTVQLEKFAPPSALPYKGYSGSGFVEISKTKNRVLKFPVTIREDGAYLLDIRYANGNGPVNTENKCAFRTVSVDSVSAGTLVFPQRGKDEWSNWGWSNSLRLALSKGVHHISISFEPWNENMNVDVNQAMLDCVRLIKL